MSVLQASGARPLTFWASAISTAQPCCSRVSWTNRAPVIDSITAHTGSPWTSLDPAGERPQRVGVGRDGELVEMLSLIGEQADVEPLSTEIQSSVQHVRRASLVLVSR